MDTVELSLLLLAHLLLTALPGVAAALFAAHRGVRSEPILLAILLGASAAVGMLGFWTFFVDPVIGESFSYFAMLGSVLVIAACVYLRPDRQLLLSLGVPLALWALGSAFILFLGFAHGGTETPVATAVSRFSTPLPGDSSIPLYFSDWFFVNGHSGRPPIFPGEWQFSDRPPLQVGYVLSQRTFGWDALGLNYQLIGIVLQQLWIVGLWALLVAARVGRTGRGLALIAVLLSNLVILNSFFVWPKLLPAALLLAAAALVLTPLWEVVRRSLPAAALLGLLCGLAMMGHGSSVFGIVPLAFVAAYRAMPSWRWIGVAAAAGAVLMASWAAYQKYEDPPGNRLTKYTLGGTLALDDRGTLETIVDGYSEEGLGGAIDNKLQNYITMTGGETARQAMENAFDEGSAESVIGALRFVTFLYLLPSIGLLLLGAVAMALRRRAREGAAAEWRYAITSFVVFGIGVFIWGLVVFGNAETRTVVHVCSYLLPILAISGCVVGLRAVLPRLAILLVALNSLLVLAIYVPAYEPMPGTSYEPLHFVLAALTLAGFLALALRAGDDPAPSARPTEPASPS